MRLVAIAIALAAIACGSEARTTAQPDPPDGTIAIPGATFFLDRTPVTVAAFRASGLSTTAERLGGSVIDLSTGSWRIVPGATYVHPLGPDAPAARDDEPATQIAWNDATAFCARRGARLPTEEEWERAARNGRDDRTIYPWGDDAREGGRWRANVWQGAFPTANTLEDGFLFASPVGTFPPTPIGLSDMVGNVWQWTSSAFDAGKRVIRGGSFLCDADVCHGYRIDARQGVTPESALMHVGFRCAMDAR
jgi:sulfatase modifying factor 1